ncbi:NADH:flavin oxidoreductase/NADH oxidase [Acinetobacter nectaris]|uniref:NADH:flavin oxidoreductase/NADH oxidase n=1 Tax=Acinetobacter nectaris TaxID=1219382 RepID=UPI001F36FDD2|nr:NADH:flavin oxidoreductase/NADH oxidase [Acinetobacter nectaris]MCF8998814.1 NADH:flavin oxidoreductase/NADH oxidase [Acinetobacter nectaris]MCF9027945.1 NADH:flavin oxidoreductase/NADH oxidase [Acinetobacter nectaris]
MKPLLFKPLALDQLELANKICIAPMCQYAANFEGEIQFWHEQQWASYALSGAGLCIVEATAINPEGRISDADLGLWNDSQALKMQAVLSKISTISPMPFAIQLSHAGRKASVEAPWKNQDSMTVDRYWQTVTPSNIPFLSNDRMPSALGAEDIIKIKQDFIEAARRAVQVGFRLIEIHAAHGYLLHQFLSPLSNIREDKYGGSLENRCRLILEIIQEIKQVLPKGFPLGIRISATDWMKSEGWDLESSIYLSTHLERLGIAYIHVSSGGLHRDQTIDVNPNYQVPFAQAIKAKVNVPIIAVGLITEPTQAEDILQKDQADAIAIARAIQYNPRWSWYAAQALGEGVAVAPQYLRCEPYGHRGRLFKPF